MFAHLTHADWSMHPRGRWVARASRVDGGWIASAPTPVAGLDDFMGGLAALAARGPTLAGFDFPIGVPAAYGRRTDFADFPDALDRFGPAVFRVAERPEQIDVSRPFYPARPGGTRRQHLLDGHRVASFDALMRRCERGGPGLRAAGSLFWTLGAAQVGRAALHGWAHVLRPLRRTGARLWPFDGELDALAGGGRLVVAETYPADGYARLDATFGPRESKRRRADRAGKATALHAFAARRRIRLCPDLVAAIDAGFGDADTGGDAFDATIGLLAMIDALAVGVPPPPDADEVRRWEGWIVGRPTSA